MTTNHIIQEVTTSLIAILLIIGTLAIVSFEVVNGKPIMVPDILIALDFAVGGLYFGNFSARNGARQAGTAAAQTAFAATAAAQKANGTAGNVPPTV